MLLSALRVRTPRLGLLRHPFLLASATVLFVVLVVSLTPVTAPLPPYTGEYEVGILDLETEVERRSVHDAVLKETGQKVFELQTLAMTLYYPSPLLSLPTQPWARPWLPQPISLIGTGYARLLHIYFPPLQSLITFALWALGSRVVIPGIVDAPLLASMDSPAEAKQLGKVIGGIGVLGRAKGESSVEELLELRGERGGLKLEPGMGELPCVVFTHGMAGMSQSYSHYLGSIASHGYVVAAVEHRDGSGPGTIVHLPDEPERPVWHLKPEDLVSDPPMTPSDLKTAQLAFRQAEIQETIRLFARVNYGKNIPIVNLKPDASASTLSSFKNRLNMSAITVSGHSYGATGALQALKNAPNAEMPVNGAIVLDPGKGSGPLNDEIDVPTLVMQSGQWTEKQLDFYGQGKHFDVVRKLVRKTRKGWFMTLAGSAHPSCTDAPLIVPWIMKLATGTSLNGAVTLKEYVSTSVEFLEYLRSGEKRGVLESAVTSPAGPFGDAEERVKVKGKHGADWEVHVVPER